MTERRKGGFASMDPQLVREIARKGGKAAHAQGTAHRFTSEEGRTAGAKGGRACHKRRLEQMNASSPKFDNNAETIPAPPPEDAVDG
jgi:general stress protein YciG